MKQFVFRLPVTRESGAGAISYVRSRYLLLYQVTRTKQNSRLYTGRSSREANGSQAARRIISTAKKGRAVRSAHVPPNPINTQPPRASRGSQQIYWEYRDGSDTRFHCSSCPPSALGYRVPFGTKYEARKKQARLRNKVNNQHGRP